MKKRQDKKMRDEEGFIAALDQSGGSTPRALLGYGIEKDAYKDDKEMFDLVHEMRTRIITSPAFKSDHILAAILFEKTMDSKVDGKWTADYLWQEKGIVPILKVDRGLEGEEKGVQMMKPIIDLDELLHRGIKRNIYGTKMRSVIKKANSKGIEDIVKQQFDYGKKIIGKGLVPILEPEIDIDSPQKQEAEKIMKEEILKQLDGLSDNQKIMLKLTIPTQDDFYSELINHPKVIRVAALSGGYSREKSVDLLSRNPGLIASFSRALLEGLSVNQTDKEFNQMLENSIEKIYKASIV